MVDTTRVTRSCTLVVFCAVALRYSLFLSGVHQWIRYQVELVTPVTSWKRVLEGLSLLDHGISPYSGDTVHEMPLVLLLFNVMKDYCDALIPIIFIVCDVATGIILYKSATLHCSSQLANQKRDLKNYAADVKDILQKPDDLQVVPFFVMTSYLLNPFTIGTCVAQSTATFTNLFVVLALYYSLLGSISLSTCFVAIATYKSLYPVMLIAPVVLIIRKHSQCTTGSDRTVMSHIALVTTFFLFWMAFLIGLSYHLVGSWAFLQATYGFILSVPDLTPNMGLFWYLFLEMFDHFREFFIMVFQLNAFFYIIPLVSLLRNHPVFLFYTIASEIAIFKSYPTFGDFSVPFALLVSWSHLFPYLKSAFVVGVMLLVSSALAPLFWYLWIYAGSANANFFYAATLAYSSAQIFLLGAVIFAFLRRNFDLEHGITRKTVDGQKMMVVIK